MRVIRLGQIHGTTVAIEDRAVLVLGRAGAGKSTLALQLMAVGAVLVADDRTVLTARGGGLFASAPKALAGRIEARGVGILGADHQDETKIALVLDLDQSETERLPPARRIEVEGVRLPLVFGPYQPHLYAVVRQMLLGGRVD